MKSRAIILIGVIFLAHATLTGQRPAKAYLGYSTLNEIYAGLKLETKVNKYISLEAGYIIPLRKEALFNVIIFNLWTIPLRELNTKGVNVRLGWNLKCVSDNCFDIFLEYGRLGSNNFRKQGFQWDGPPAEYSEFTEKYNNFAFGFSESFDLKKNGRTSMFIAGGLKYQNVLRSYSIIGTFYSQTPSNKIERLHRFVPVFNLGLHLNLVK